MKYRKLFIISSACLLLVGCGGKESDTGGAFELTDFKEVRLKSADASLVTDDVDVLGHPAFIRMMNDSVIAIRRVRNEYPVMLYNQSNRKSIPAIMIGQAPDEMQSVNGLSADKEGNLWLIGPADGKVMIVSWNGTDSVARKEFLFKTPLPVLGGAALSDNDICVMPTSENDVRFLRLNRKGEEIKSYSIFPEIKLPTDTLSISNMMVQSDISASPDGKNVVMVCKSFPYIQIFDIEKDVEKTLTGPGLWDIEVEAKDTSYGTLYTQKPMVFMYEGVAVGKESFFVGYNGTEPKTKEDFESGINSLLEFDWEGHPKRRIVFERDVLAFDVDGENGVVYTLENNPDPALYHYNLPAD